MTLEEFIEANGITMSTQREIHTWQEAFSNRRIFKKRYYVCRDWNKYHGDTGEYIVTGWQAQGSERLNVIREYQPGQGGSFRLQDGHLPEYQPVVGEAEMLSWLDYQRYQAASFIKGSSQNVIDPLTKIKWQRAGHPSGLFVHWSGIGRKRAKEIVDHYDLQRLPRIGYTMDFTGDDEHSYTLANEAGRFTITRMR